jgi:hypothetical protein
MHRTKRGNASLKVFCDLESLKGVQNSLVIQGQVKSQVNKLAFFSCCPLLHLFS